jgi:integrase
VDFRTETIRAGVRAGASQTKTRRGRPVPMTRRVFMQLWGMWHAAGKPEAGTVFLSSRGEPYEDAKDKGGNPLRSAHATACRKAGILGFRVHDWRHDWTARRSWRVWISSPSCGSAAGPASPWWSAMRG